MANRAKRISELTALESASLQTTLVGVDNGTTYKVTLDVLEDAIINMVSRSTDLRLDSLEAYTSSVGATYVPLGTISSSAQISDFGFISSSHTDITSLNSFTSSQLVLNTAFNSGISARLQTSSFNDFSASVDSRILAATNEQSFNGLVSGSSQFTASYDERYVLSGSITQTTWDNIANKPSGIVSQSTDLSSLNSFTQSIDNRVDSLESWSSSLTDTFATDLEVSIVSSSVAATIGIISQNTGLLSTSSFNSYTASISTASLVDRLNIIESVSGSWITENETGSFLTSLSGAISSSSQLTSSYDSRYSLSGSVLTTFSESVDNRLDLLETLNHSYTGSISGSFTGSAYVDYIIFNSSSTTPLQSYMLQANTTDKTLNLRMGNNATQQIGQEIYFPPIVNKSGVDLNDGDLVMVNPTGIAQGNRISVVKAVSDGTYAADKIVGVLTENVANNQEGFATWFGYVRDVSITHIQPAGETWAEGDILYPNPTIPGALTNVFPTAPNLRVTVATITSINGNNVTILVNFHKRTALKRAHDVLDNSTTSSYGDILMKSGSVWVNNTSISSSLVSLNASTSSYETKGRGIVSGSSQLTSSFDTRYAPSASYLTSLNGAFSSSIQTLGGSGVYSSSAQLPSGLISGSSQLTTFETKGSGIYSSSVQLPSGLISGSSQLTASYDTRYTLSGSVSAVPAGTISGSAQITAFGFVSSSTSVPAGTISGSSQLTSSFDGRYVQTGSFNTLTASFNSFTASAQSVTTGSNSFNGTQIITGSLIITTGSFVGSQILANTSSLYLTSGSNIYVQNNGLVEITGSLTATSITGSIAATNGVISSSAQITAFGFVSSSNGTPSGTISSSAQITAFGFVSGSYETTGRDIVSGSSQITPLLPSGVVSGSSQVLDGSGVVSGSYETTGRDIVSGSSQITSLLPTGTISGSSQLTSSYDVRYTLSGSVSAVPDGTISGSAQITSFGFVSGSYETTGRGIISSSADLVTTSSFNSYTASISTASLVTSISNLNTTTASLNISLNALNTATASYLTSLSGAISSSSQLTSSFDTRYALSGSGTTISTGSFATTGSNTFTGLQTFQQIQEVISLKPSLGLGTNNFDFNSGSIFYIAGLTGSGTWNVQNIPSASNSATSLTFVIQQGVTAYSASAYQLGGTAITVKWLDGIIPTGSASSTDVIGLTAFRSGSSWNVIGSLSKFS